MLNQVLLHQSVIGLEAKAALEKYDVKPDIIIGCAGGGSNLGGLISPFMGENSVAKMITSLSLLSRHHAQALQEVSLHMTSATQV